MTPTLATETSTALPDDGLEHEQVAVRRGARSRAQLMVAIHSTALGPALGGARMWRYRSPLDGLRDALRLSRAMTYKAAAAGLDLGGGKGVICTGSATPPEGAARRDLLLDFADLVESLDGRYITAEDIGTGADDIEVMAERTSHLTGLPVSCGGSGDPSPLTALGVEAAMRACARHRFGSRELAGLRVVVIGLGHVGSALAGRLDAAGSSLGVTDVDPAKREIAEDLGAEWLDPEMAPFADCDVLAPCALGGTIDSATVEGLRCAIVCGSANNVLADDALDAELEAAGVLYAPDFIANAGGLINVYREIRGYGAEHANELVLGIEQTTEHVLADAEHLSVTPLDAAYALARRRLERARRPSLEAAVG